eukprot:gene19212-22966_t
MGFKRRPYICICCAGSCASYLVTAVFVDSTPALFLVTTSRAFFNAFGQLMIGAFLVDISHKELENAPVIQSVATGTRFFGSIVSYLLTLPLYPCHGSSYWSARTVIGVASIFPLFSAMFCLWLPEERVRGGDEENSGERQLLRATPAGNSTGPEVSRTLPRTLVVAGLTVCFMSAGIKSLLSYTTWVYTCSASAMFACLILLGVARSAQGFSCPRSVGELRVLWGKHHEVVRPSLFLLLFCAVPKADIQAGNFMYSAFSSHLCEHQVLQLLGFLASTIGCVVYGVLSRGRRTWVMLTILSVISASANLLKYPLIQDWRHLDEPHVHRLAFAYAALVSVLGGMLYELAFIPLSVLAIERCPNSNKGMMYGVYLSFLNLGDSVSSWSTAPIVASLGITYTNWTPLGDLILITSGIRVASLLLLPLIWDDSGRVGQSLPAEEGNLDVDGQG